MITIVAAPAMLLSAGFASVLSICTPAFTVIVALAAAGVNEVVQSAVSEEKAGIRVGAEEPTKAPACTPNVAF